MSGSIRFAIVLTLAIAVSGCAASKVYRSGLRDLERNELADALDSFDSASRMAPSNVKYQAAARSTRQRLVREALSDCDRLPVHDLPGRLDVLRLARKFEVDPSTPSLAPSSGVISSRIIELESKLASVESAALAVDTEPDERERARMLEALLSYRPFVSAADAAIRKAMPAIVGWANAELLAGRTDEAQAVISMLERTPEMEAPSRKLAEILAAVERERAALAESERQKQSANLSKLSGTLASKDPAIAWVLLEQARRLAGNRALDAAESQLRTRLEGTDARRILIDDSVDEATRRLLSASLPPSMLRKSGKGLEVTIELSDIYWKVSPGTAEQVWSTFLAGSMQVPNPAYPAAQSRYQQAREMAAQTSGTMAGIAWGYALGKATRELQETPAYLREPVYQDYSYQRRRVSEDGRVAFRVSLRDSLTKQEYVSEEIVETDRSSMVEVFGAHPADQNGAANHSYSREDSLERQRRLKVVAAELAAKKATKLFEVAYLSRAEDLMQMSAPREALEAKCMQLFLQSVEGSNADTEVIAEEILHGLPAPAPQKIKKVADARSAAMKTADLQSAAGLEIGSLKNRLGSTEAVVACAMPSLVKIRTFVGEGSGFIVDKKGLVLTNSHVVDGARDIAAVTADGRQFLAEALHVDRRRDIAVLRIRGAKFSAIKLRVGAPVTGETVLALGAPDGLDNTVTQGIVSAYRRLGALVDEQTLSLLGLDGSVMLVQTDAAINPGNSGGPLVDMACQAVGINTWKRQGNEGLGFAVSSTEVQRVLSKAAPR